MSESTSNVTKLQQQIIQVKNELLEINKQQQSQPELIETTNILRANEYLKKSVAKQTQLLSLYEEYANELEKLVLSTSVIKAKIKQLKSRSKPRKPVTKRTRKPTKKRKRKPVRKIKRKPVRKTKRRR